MQEIGLVRSRSERSVHCALIIARPQVDPDKLKPGDLVGTNKDNYLILETLPAEYDARVKAMEVDEKPQEDFGDIGGLDKEIQELVEAVVLPTTHRAQFEALGIRPPKGVLMFGPPGVGKT
jgi:26S proteasome regulatory subunit T5